MRIIIMIMIIIMRIRIMIMKYIVITIGSDRIGNNEIVCRYW